MAAGARKGEGMERKDYVDLANFRLALRRFLAFSEAAVGTAGVTSQQYQALLAIKASATDSLAIKELAAELLLAPNGAVQLVDRLEAQGLVARRSLETDHRVVLIALTPEGEKVVEALATQHLTELVQQRPLLAESLRRLRAIGK